MLYIDSNTIEKNNFRYKKIYTDENHETINNGYNEDLVFFNEFEENNNKLFKLLDKVIVITYELLIQLLGELSINKDENSEDLYLYKILHSTFDIYAVRNSSMVMLDKIVLQKIRKRIYKQNLFEIVSYLKNKFNINGIYISTTFNNDLEIVPSHIYYL